MRKYKFIKAEKKNLVTETVTQLYYNIGAKDRIEGLRRIIDYYTKFHGILFCNTKASVDTVTNNLLKQGYRAAGIHGDITQSQREKILQQFKNKHFQILIATDVAARGIDVNDLTHVINFSLPQSPESYVHRIGRTGRAGKEGIAITFLMPSERRRLGLIERVNSCTLQYAEIPSAKEIVANKEYTIKKILKASIEANKNKTNKYTQLAQTLLEEHTPEEVVTSALKYAFKNELEITTYKALSKPKSDERAPADADHSRRRGGFSRGGDRRGGDRRGGDRRGGDRRDSSTRENRGRSRGGSRGDSPSSRFRSDRRRSDRRRDDSRGGDRRSSDRNDREGFSRGDSRGGDRRDYGSKGRKPSSGGRDRPGKPRGRRD